MLMPERDPVSYKATFRGLMLQAFGRLQTLDITQEIEVYQSRSWPCIWSARPCYPQRLGDWCSSTPEGVQRQVASSFRQQLTEWQAWHNGPFGKIAPKRPFIVPKPQKAVGS